MGQAVKITVLFTLLAAASVSAADEPAPAAKVWIEQYGKLGGEALLWPPPDETTISITKREGQKPLVGLKGLKPAAGIRRMVLQGFEVDDDDVAALAKWNELEEIGLIDCKKVTDKGVKELAALTKLRILELADTSVTAAGVNAFSGHKELAHLTVSNTIVDCRVTALDLKEMPKLEGLILVCAGMTTVRLTKMPKLVWVGDFPLELEQAEMTELGSLTELDFRSTRLKKLVLSGIPKLESLDLRRTQLDADALAGVRKAFPGVKVQR
jgi:hypothetical protein